MIRFLKSFKWVLALNLVFTVWFVLHNQYYEQRVATYENDPYGEGVVIAKGHGYRNEPYVIVRNLETDKLHEIAGSVNYSISEVGKTYMYDRGRPSWLSYAGCNHGITCYEHDWDFFSTFLLVLWFLAYFIGLLILVIDAIKKYKDLEQ